MKTASRKSVQSSRFNRNFLRGFSLVELLTCIAVLGLIVAMAIPSLAGMVQGSVSAKSQRQAQTIAQTYTSACAAGAVFADANPETIVETLTQAGGVRGKGVFADMIFRVSMSAAEKIEVVRSKALVTQTLPDGTMHLIYRPDAAR